AWTIRCGTTRPSRRTATGCWRVRSRPGFLRAVLAQPRVKRLLSSEHFSVEGTLIEAQASMKSFGPKKPPDAGGAAGGGITLAMAAGVTTKLWSLTDMVRVVEEWEASGATKLAD